MLHCNSSYPSKDEELDLDVIRLYKYKYRFKVGYSGHEIDTLHTLSAVAMGVDIIERHITLDKIMEGSDHKCSLNIDELKKLISDIKRVKTTLGNRYVTLYESEMVARRKLRCNK